MRRIKLSTNTTKPIENFYEKANALMLENSYKEAVSNYLNAILIDRNNAESYYELGICYKNLKQYAKAIKYLETASELKENYYEAFYEMGICHLSEGIPCGAIKNFIRAIQINPDKPDAVLQLGIAHELCEEYDLSLMIYQKLIENSPEFIKAYEHKSTLLMKLERYKEAYKILNQVQKINPDYKSAFAGMGVCLEKLGKLPQAQRFYIKYLTSAPFSKEAAFVKNRLNKLRNKNYKTANLYICK